ncbi:hypothetical protein BGZ82_005589 [Podila clonocystis]|nr:hypothetical protein BGZ82_005589 [Podila clonocystis]
MKFSTAAILAVIATVAFAADPTTTTAKPTSAAPTSAAATSAATTSGGATAPSGTSSGAPAASSPAKSGAIANQANTIVAFAGVGLAMALGL